MNTMNIFYKKTLKVKNYIIEKKWQIAMMLYAILAPINIAYGAANPNPTPSAADSKWTAMINFILPWIQRLGGVVLLIGAVEFGLAFKNDDAEGKTKGMRTAIAGCIVIAVGLSSSTFLMP